MIKIYAFLALFPFATSLAFASAGAGGDQFICGTATVLGANAPGAGESGFWTVVAGTGNFNDSNSPTAIVSGLSFGENILRWTLVAAGGPSSDLVSIWCYNSQMPEANAGPDQTVDGWPGSAQLNASVPVAPGTCFWTFMIGAGVLSDFNDPEATINGLSEGTNVLQWHCDNGPCGNSEDDIVINAVVGIDEAGMPGIDLRYDAGSHRLLFGQGSPSMSIRLFDGQGRVVDQLVTPAGAGAWDLGAMPSGIYVAQATMHGGSSVLRFALGH